MEDIEKEVLLLLSGIENGTLKVKSYESKWIMNGIASTNTRKMTIYVEDI
jgi:hypothetical protein